MFKKFHFRGPFDKQYGKRDEALSKFPSQHFYQIHLSLLRQLCWKKSLFLTCKILGLLVNTLASHENYLLLHRDNLTIPIKMQLSQKQKPFSQLLAAFLRCSFNFKHFEKRMTLIDFVFSKLQTPKT